MAMPEEAFEGELLRQSAEQYSLQIKGLTDQEIRQECYKAIKDSDVVGAFEYKHGCSWVQWDKDQWDELLNTVEVEQALTNPLLKRKYAERVDTAVSEVFPVFEDCYDPSFAVCLTTLTTGDQEKMKSVLEQLVEIHSEHASKEELSCYGDGYTGQMLYGLYQMGLINL